MGFDLGCLGYGESISLRLFTTFARDMLHCNLQLILVGKMCNSEPPFYFEVTWEI
jgi:hypothetical protein